MASHIKLIRHLESTINWRDSYAQFSFFIMEYWLTLTVLACAKSKGKAMDFGIPMIS
jgi:hypothetical protein